MDRARWWLPILDISDGARGNQDQDEDYEYGEHGPCRFDLVTALDLRRLAGFVSSAMAVADEGIDE